MGSPLPSPLAPKNAPASVESEGPAGLMAPIGTRPGTSSRGLRRLASFPLSAPAPGAPRAARRERLWKIPIRVTLGLLALHLLAFNLSVVRGSSMQPGILDGDRILIDQVSYLLGGVNRGDVVVLRYPLDPRLDYIKRVVGLPGDRVAIEGGTVWINGVELAEPYVDRPDPSTPISTTVREGHYFVLGDNRPHSSDSREFGQVPAEYLRGRVDLRIWPPERIGLVR